VIERIAHVRPQFACQTLIVMMQPLAWRVRALQPLESFGDAG
jgi:hypothetical protein